MEMSYPPGVDGHERYFDDAAPCERCEGTQSITYGDCDGAYIGTSYDWSETLHKFISTPWVCEYCNNGKRACPECVTPKIAEPR